MTDITWEDEQKETVVLTLCLAPCPHVNLRVYRLVRSNNKPAGGAADERERETALPYNVNNVNNSFNIN